MVSQDAAAYLAAYSSLLTRFGGAKFGSVSPHAGPTRILEAAST